MQWAVETGMRERPALQVSDWGPVMMGFGESAARSLACRAPQTDKPA